MKSKRYPFSYVKRLDNEGKLETRVLLWSACSMAIWAWMHVQETKARRG